MPRKIQSGSEGTGSGNQLLPPSPGQPSTKERYLKYFDEETVNKYMQDIQNYLTGREISLKTNAVFINATK